MRVEAAQLLPCDRLLQLAEVLAYLVRVGIRVRARARARVSDRLL